MDPHYVRKLDPDQDPHLSENLDPHKSRYSEALDDKKRTLEGHGRSQKRLKMEHCTGGSVYQR